MGEFCLGFLVRRYCLIGRCGLKLTLPSLKGSGGLRSLCGRLIAPVALCVTFQPPLTESVQMRILTSSLSLLVLCMAASTSMADFVVLDQLSDPFTPTDFGGRTTNTSFFDTTADAGAGEAADYARGYENFSHTTAGTTTTFSWVGGREFLPGVDPGNNFRISFFEDVGGQPPAYSAITPPPSHFFQVTATSVDVGNDFNLYTANVGFDFAANTDYWFSIQNEASFNDNSWAWALAPGDGSFQDFQTDGMLANPVQRFNDAGFGYAVRVSAVPEPSSAMLGLVGLGLIGFRRRRA